MIEIVIALFAAWAILLYIAKKWGAKYGFEPSGPLLMWKTEKGRKLIDRISRRRGWKAYGNLSIVICAVAMILTTFLIILNVIISFQISPQNAPSPRLMLGIPGINPIIPIGYGIIALAIAIVIHEFSHGILARFEKIKVKTLGLIFLIVPLGAFVEPDEEHLNKVKRAKRARVFAAGPTSNIVLAILCIIILSFVFSPLITPRTDGVVVTQDAFGIPRWSVIDGMDNVDIHSLKEMKEMLAKIDAGKFYNVTLFGNNSKNYMIMNGLYVANVIDNSPAHGEIEKGCIIYKIDNEYVANTTKFLDIMDSKKAGDKIEISYYYNNSFFNKNITLSDRYQFTREAGSKGKGFLGIEAYGMEDVIIDASFFSNIYNPLKGRFLPYLALPFMGLSPPPQEIMDIYTPSPLFWSIYNLIYWIFWLNFAVGTFNALPAIPLDGGYLFRDGVDYIFSLIFRDKKKSEKFSSLTATTISLIIFLSVFAIILVPRLRELISF